LAEEIEDYGEKTEEPSSYRIDEFRKRGEVASSRELTSVLILAANVFFISIGLFYLLEIMEEYVQWLYSLNFATAFTPKSMDEIGRKTLILCLKSAGPVFLISILVGVLSHIGQFGFLWAPAVLEIKMERLNPLDGFRKILSFKGLVEVFKSISKFGIIISLVYLFFANRLLSFPGFFHLELVQSFIYGKSLVVALAFLILIGLFVVALADLAYQKLSYQRKIKQTREQFKREQKEHEGNPEIKQRIRSIQREVARKRMIQEVKKADVLITNPTHYSVALKYDSKKMVSPKVVGKGADHLALNLRKVAKESGVPVVENVFLARNLYNNCKVGEFIPRELYKAVAEVLAFVYKLRKKEKILAG
jgi:flagellar biosynthetic protein FlhB